MHSSHPSVHSLTCLPPLSHWVFIHACARVTNHLPSPVVNNSSNRLGDDGVGLLAPALGRNKTLLELDLSFNDIATAGARALGESLSNNTTLRALNLGGNQIDDSGALSCSMLQIALSSYSTPLQPSTHKPPEFF